MLKCCSLGGASPQPRSRSKNKKTCPRTGKEIRSGSSDDGPSSSTDTSLMAWSQHEKYDGDIFLESNYKKHLSRHANK